MNSSPKLAVMAAISLRRQRRLMLAMKLNSSAVRPLNR